MVRILTIWLNAVRRSRIAHAIAFSALIGIITSSIPWLALVSYDVGSCFRPPSIQTNAALIYANGNTLRELGSNHGDISRTNHARLINRLTCEGAAIVLYDFNFFEAGSDSAEDEALKNAVRNSGRVILFAPIKESQDKDMRTAVVFAPFKALRDAAGTNGWGHAELKGETVRQITHSIEAIEYAPWVAFNRLQTQRSVNQKPDSVRWLNYYGSPISSAIPSYNFEDVVLTNGTPPGFFRGKMVFVGQNYPTAKLGRENDTFPTPYSDFGLYGMTPGVAIHATAFLNLIQDDWLRLPSRSAHCLIIIIWAVLLATILDRISRQSILLLLVITIGAAALLIASSLYVQWHHRIWWSWLGPSSVQAFATLGWVRFHPRPREKYLVFLSYRRSEDDAAAGTIHERLTELGVKVFRDVNTVVAGRPFDQQLYAEIENAKYYLPILSPNALRACVEPNDWLLNEIVHALKHKKLIIPIFTKGFDPKVKRDIPNLPAITDLLVYQGIPYDSADSRAFARRLLRLLEYPKV